MKIKVLIVVLIGLLSSCESTEQSKDGTSFSENFVQVYYIPSEVCVYQAGEGDEYRNYAVMDFRGEAISNRRTADKDRFNALAEKYNDLSYNRRLVPYSNIALGVEYSVIDITCDATFDDEHAAGESLGDVVMLCANSFKKFVEDGYDHSYEYPEYIDEHWCFQRDYGMYPVFKPLNEVTREDLILVEPTMYLYFTKTPAAGEYDFTVSLRVSEESGTDGAGDLTAKFKMTFE